MLPQISVYRPRWQPCHHHHLHLHIHLHHQLHLLQRHIPPLSTSPIHSTLRVVSSSGVPPRFGLDLGFSSSKKTTPMLPRGYGRMVRKECAQTVLYSTLSVQWSAVLWTRCVSSEQIHANTKRALWREKNAHSGGRQFFISTGQTKKLFLIFFLPRAGQSVD